MQDTHKILRLAVLALASTALVACSSDDDSGGLIDASAPPVVVGSNDGDGGPPPDTTPTIDVDNGPVDDNSNDGTDADIDTDTTVGGIVDDGADNDTGTDTNTDTDDGALIDNGTDTNTDTDNGVVGDDSTNDDIADDGTDDSNTGDDDTQLPPAPLADEVPPTLPDPFALPVPGPSFPDPFNTFLEEDDELAVAGGPPTTPKNLRIELVSNDWAQLSWAPANDDGEVVAYRLFRSDGVIYDIERDQSSPNGGTQAEINEIFRTTSFIDCNFTRFFDSVHFCSANQPVPGETYTYQVSAIDNEGQESPRSNELTITYHESQSAPVPRYEDPFLGEFDDFAQRNDLGETRFFLDEFTTVFSDEFTGDSIDPRKWTTDLIAADSIVNGEQQFYVNTQEQPDFGYDPFSFTGDSLIISAIPVPDDLRSQLPPQCDEVDPSGIDRCEFLSGALSSHSTDESLSKFQFLYGYAEGRMRVSGSDGALSSFFLFHRFPGGDILRHAPEIDILEYLGNNMFGDEDAFQTYHYENPLTGDIMSSPTMNYANPTGELFSDDFHTYSVLWEPSLIIWYVDGVEIRRLTGPQVARQPQVLVGFLVAGSEFAGTPDAADPDIFPFEYEVDYIRVMQREPFVGAGFLEGQEDLSE